MKFFRDMNLARGILLLSVLGSIVLGYIGWKQSAVVEELEQANDTRVPHLVNEIQQLSIEHTRLARELSGDQWVKEANADGYIYSCGDQVGMGLMKFDRSVDANTGGRGIIDQRTRIQPDNPRREYDRYRIAQFMHRLEANSQRVRITKAKLNLIEKARPSDIPSDRWTFDIDITTRVREDEPATN